MVSITAKFDGDLVAEIDKFIDDGTAEYESDVQALMEQAYETIVANSPVWTGYYASNHGIVVRGPSGQFKTQGFRLSPGEKESNQRFIYQANIDSRAGEEVQKLEKFKAGDSITIINDVPYAGEIEREGTKTSNGNIYANAAAQFGLDYEGE